MAGLKALISQSNRNRANFRSFFSLCAQHSLASPTPTQSLFILPSNGCIRRNYLFRPGLFSPMVGPLFLSNPPWKLLQSATPLLMQSDAVLNFLKLRALNLLQRPAFAYGLSSKPRLFHKEGVAEFQNRAVIDGSVYDRSLWESYFNLPNYISFARLLSGPVLGWMILHDLYSSAFVGLAISGASDWLDGYAARKMKIDSVVGSYLDPLADKVLIGCVVLAMVDKDLLHPGLIALIVMRDVGLLGGALYLRASNLKWQWNNLRALFDLDGAHAEKVKPLFISKVNTFFQLILVAGSLLQPGFGNEETHIYLNYLSLLVGLTTVGSTAAYGVQFRRFGAGMPNNSSKN